MYMKKQGIVSVEYFSHYRCGQCNKWWGIGDPPPSLTEQFCPWCGYKQTFVDKTPKNLEVNK